MSRLLTHLEYQFAFQNVFQATIPLVQHIHVDGSLGLGGRPWTNWDDGDAWLHLGPLASEDLTRSDKRFPSFGRYCDVFIHEMTHVWQYYHGRFVKTNAIAHQLLGWAEDSAVKSAYWYPLVAQSSVPDFSDIYTYQPGQPWGSYNVEQQAQIVEDWFSSDPLKDNPGKASTSDWRWTHIQQIRLSGETYDADLAYDRVIEDLSAPL